MQQRHRTAHRWIWTAFALVLPLFLWAALSRAPPAAKPPVRLAPPAETAKP